jgi:hypothetical protein
MIPMIFVLLIVILIALEDNDSESSEIILILISYMSPSIHAPAIAQVGNKVYKRILNIL